MKFDMHCHTKEGSLDGKVPLTEYVASLKSQGFQGMLITDHNSYKAYNYYKEHCEEDSTKDIFKDFVILKGIEYDTLDAGHFLLVLPSEFRLPLFELRGMPLPLLIKMVHQFGGILGPAHPFGEKFLSFGRSRYYKHHEEIMADFDFLEGFNACESKEDNDKAVALAEKYHLPCFGGSDSHQADNIGLAYTSFPASITTVNDLIAYVKEKKPIAFGGDRYYGTIKEHLGKWNDVLVYSYFFYNKTAALWRSLKRKAALKSARLLQHFDFLDSTVSADDHTSKHDFLP